MKEIRAESRMQVVIGMKKVKFSRKMSPGKSAKPWNLSGNGERYHGSNDQPENDECLADGGHLWSAGDRGVAFFFTVDK